MGFGFGNSIYLDFHQAELQLLVTQSYTTRTKDFMFSVVYSVSWILLSDLFSRGISVSVFFRSFLVLYS
jgi:hypothetical protein